MGVSLISAIVFTAVMMLRSHPVTESIDWVLHGEPNLQYLRKSLLDGEFPWWNPHVGLGRPYASDLQSAVYYPPTYLYLLGELEGLSLFLCLHAFLLITGMHLLCRQLGGRGVFGWLGGCALLASLGFGGRLLVGHTFYFAGLCYLPILLTALTRLRLQPTAGRTGGFALLLALQFLTGHPQVFWISVFGLGLFLLGLLLQPGPAVYWRRIPRVIAGFGAAILLAAGITAIAWLPFLDLIAQGNRQASTLEFASYLPFQAADVYCILTKLPQGGPWIPWESNCRLGFAWAVPGLIGLSMLRNAGMRALMLMGACSLWFSFGAESWLFRVCFDFLPGASSFRNPARINALTVLALTAAAAAFLGRSRQLVGFSRLAVVAIGCALALLLGAQKFTGPSGAMNWLEPLLMLLVAVGTVYVLKFCGGFSFTTKMMPLLLWFGLQILELAGAHAQYGRAYSYEEVYRLPSTFPVAQLLEERLPTAPAGTPARIMLPRHVTPPNFGMQHHWAHVDSYTALFLSRPWEYIHRSLGVEPPAFFNASLADTVYERSLFSIPNLSLDLGLDSDLQVFVTNTNPLPRLWITLAPRLVGSPGEALAAVTNRLDLPREGVIESPLPFASPPTTGATGGAAILRFRSSEIKVRCQLPQPGLLVLNEAWYPGWHTEVGGQRVESRPVNYWMRGFALPAGEHMLTLRFRPRHLWLAAGLSLGSMGVIVALIFRGDGFRSRFSLPAPAGAGACLIQPPAEGCSHRHSTPHCRS